MGKRRGATYLWFNGSTERYLPGDPIADPTKVLHLNLPLGSKEDKNAKIWPFKVMRGKQPYDAGNKLLAVPHLFG
ncbi:MAG: cytochrome C, partial [Firmicutes bacterium]|nr:cytochrome C [Bacillota bacterium]